MIKLTNRIYHTSSRNVIQKLHYSKSKDEKEMIPTTKLPKRYEGWAFEPKKFERDENIYKRQMEFAIKKERNPRNRALLRKTFEDQLAFDNEIKEKYPETFEELEDKSLPWFENPQIKVPEHLAYLYEMDPRKRMAGMEAHADLFMGEDMFEYLEGEEREKALKRICSEIEFFQKVNQTDQFRKLTPEDLRQTEEFMRRQEEKVLLEDFKKEQQAQEHQHAVIKFTETFEMFYDNVEVVGTPTEGYKVRCGIRFVASQLGNVVVLPSLELAQLLAVEWELQTKDIRAKNMPITTFLTSAADMNVRPKDRMDAFFYLKEALEVDEIRHREYSDPSRKQKYAELWDPILEKINKHYNIDLPVYNEDDISLHFKNSEKLAEAYKVLEEQTFSKMDNIELSLLMFLNRATESMAISLALLNRWITPEEAWEASTIVKRNNAGIHIEGETDVYLQEKIFYIAAANVFYKTYYQFKYEEY